MRVCFYIDKRVDLDAWSSRTNQNIHIFNIYNEVTTKLSDHCRPRSGPSAEHLLRIIEDSQLQLLTVPGTPTHRWRDGEFTIDLTFASEEVAARVTHCKIDKDLDGDSEPSPDCPSCQLEPAAC
jgi:hypothetical protein